MNPAELRDRILGEMNAGTIPKGSLIPDPRKAAALYGTTIEVVHQAYNQLLTEDRITAIGVQLFAASPKELQDDTIENPCPALLRARGQFFSLREEEPDRKLHMKINERTEGQYRDPRMHAHDYTELVYVKGGSGSHRIQGRIYPVYAGDCFIALPGDKHGYSQCRNLHIVNIIFYPEEFSAYYDDLSHVPGLLEFFSLEPLFRSETSFRHKLHLRSGDQRLLEQKIANLSRELTGERPGHEIAAKMLFVDFMILVSRLYKESMESEGSTPEFSHKERIISEAISYLEKNFEGSVRVEDIARMVFLSPSRLQHVFRDATGSTLTDYLLKIRLQNACELLKGTDGTITKIALSTGFHSSSYFSSTFKKIFGVTPRTYRRSGA